MESMMAVVAHAHQDFRYEPVERPKPDKGEVIIKVTGAGVCGSDRKLYYGGVPWDLHFPFIPGHEYTGEVVELGPNAAQQHGLRVGDQVVAEIVVPCRNCEFCMSGHYHLCTRAKYYGTMLSGGWSEYVKLVEGSIIWKVPKVDVPYLGALVEPLACAIHAVERSDIKPNSVVVISGVGSIGLMIVQAARLKNPKDIIVLDVREDALSMALKLGASYAINVHEQDPVAYVAEITSGRGADTYIEASGNSDALEPGLLMLRRGGIMVVFGSYHSSSTVNWTYISDLKELTVKGVRMSPHSYPQAIRLLYEGMLDVRQIITHVLPLREFAKGITIDEQSRSVVGARGKVILIP